MRLYSASYAYRVHREAGITPLSNEHVSAKPEGNIRSCFRRMSPESATFVLQRERRSERLDAVGCRGSAV